MGKVIGLATLVVVGLIVGDALIHPAGTKALGATGNTLVSNTETALLGTPPKGAK